MTSTKTYLKFTDYGDQSAPLKVISLHGFPSVRSKQNRELAQGIADELKCRVRVILYPGLSAPGLFSFKKTIDALLVEFPTLASGMSSNQIDLLGHSFGGFSAILLAAKYPDLIRRVVLLSPLLRFNSSVNDVAMFFTNILGSSKDAEINTLSPQSLGIEFHELAQKYETQKLVAELHPKLNVKLMQARADDVTPTAVAEEFRQYFKCKFDFELVDQDHSFLIDRPTLAKKIAMSFR